MKYLTVLAYILLFSFISIAQVNFSVKRIASGEIPKDIKFRGQLHEAWKWSDRIGENILITSLLKPYKPSKFIENEDEKTSQSYAYHFIKKDTIYKLRWSLTDAVNNCPFDVTLEFINNSFTITDLDSDSIAETKLQYKIVCRSDVSPVGMKLIMREDSVKYALRGLMWLKQGPEHEFEITENDISLENLPKPKDEWEQYSQLPGRYDTDKDFKKAPPAFLNYARKEWLKYVKESFE
jgi:hypothetical protein